MMVVKGGSNKSSVQLRLQLPNIEPNKECGINENQPELEIEDDDEELFCRNHLLRKPVVPSTELQDLYEVLQKLPTLSFTPIRDYRSTNVSRERTLSWVATTLKKGRKRIANHQSANSDSILSHCPNSSNSDLQLPAINVDTVHSQNSSSTSSVYYPVSDDGDFSSGQPERELVKMHSINLYQSILPSTFFARSRNKHRLSK